MGIFEHQTVVKSKSVVGAAATPYSVFLHHAQSRSGFTCIQQFDIIVFDQFDKFRRIGADTAAMLHNVEDNTLVHQHTVDFTAYIADNIPFFDFVTVVNEKLNINMLHLSKLFDVKFSRKDAVLFGDHFRFDFTAVTDE